MFFAPMLGVVDGDGVVCGPILFVGADGNSQPLRALGRLDAVAIAPTVLVELNVVVNDENIAAVKLGEIAEPGQVARLQNDGYPARINWLLHNPHEPPPCHRRRNLSVTEFLRPQGTCVRSLCISTEESTRPGMRDTPIEHLARCWQLRLCACAQ